MGSLFIVKPRASVTIQTARHNGEKRTCIHCQQEKPEGEEHGRLHQCPMLSIFMYKAMLYPVVESCLSVEVLKDWDRHRLDKEIPEDVALEKEKVLENLMTFLST
ncbi:hypothetical protein TNCV_5067091 [Trichonephila clavipes]|nr:hypothetical protein TNCV_5067091 [Trichonephila clavipes]